MEALWIILAVLLFTLLLLAFIALAIRFAFKMLAEGSGWGRLAHLYTVTFSPQGHHHLRQTIGVGVVRYKKCVNICMNGQGLYLSIQSAFPSILKLPPIFIPWNQFNKIEDTMLYWRKAKRVFIGAPAVGTVTLPTELFSLIQPYLSGSPVKR